MRGGWGTAGRTTTALVVLGLLLAGCRGGTGDASTTTPSPTPTPTPTTSTPTTTTPPTTGSHTTGSTTTGGQTTGSPGPTTRSPRPTPTPSPTTETTEEKQGVIAWILSLGPGAPSGPPEFTAYRELQQGRCGAVFDRVGELDEPARTLYTGAAQGCLAALDGQVDRWPSAEAALDAVSGQTGALSCMDEAAFDLLVRLVTAHREHPDRDVRASGGNGSQAPPCPVVGSLEPRSGLAGDTVRLSGEHLDRYDRVEVVDSNGLSTPAENVRLVGGALELEMPEEPPSEGSATVCVVVVAEPDWSADGATFTYESDNLQPPQELACPPPATQ
jgi:hypothetical protein